MGCTGNDEQAISDLIDAGIAMRRKMEGIIVRVCPVCKKDVEFADGDDMTICNNCETWLNIDDENNYELSIWL